MHPGGSEPLFAHKVFTELVATEVDYVAGLETIVKAFRQPLLQERLISEDDAKIIFSTSPILLPVHRSLLLALKTRLSNFSTATNLQAPPEIGDLFLGIVSPSLETYHEFWTAREASINRLTALLACDPAFESFHRAASNKAHSSLEKLLELPILRVPKYKSLLGELMAATSTAIKKTDAFLQLSEAFDKLVVATTFVHTLVPVLFEEVQIEVGDIVEIFGIQIEGYNGQRGPVLTVTPNQRFEVLLNSGHVGKFKDSNLRKLPPEVGAAAAKVGQPRGDCALCHHAFAPSELSVRKADGSHIHKDECPKPKVEPDSEKRDIDEKPDKLEIRGECVLCRQPVMTNQPRERTPEGLYKHKGSCPSILMRAAESAEVLLDDLILVPEEKTPWQAQDAEELRQTSDWGELARKRVDQFYFQLTFDMMLGIRTTVMKAEREILGTVDASEFRKMERLFFPTEGSEHTPPHGMAAFYFKDYSPLTFRRIRARFNIDPAHYLNTICGGFQYLEFQTNSKSGEFFFFSYNREFLIKTISHNEALLLHRMLPDYYAHVMEYPDTLLTRFYGMHKVKPQAGHFVYFLIMGSVFASDLPVHSIYDLKGSKIGRSASARDKTSANCIFKDNDFVEQGVRLHIGAPKKAKLIAQLKKDVMFLQSFQVMDYSLLVGIHYCDRHDQQAHSPPDAERRVTNRAVDAGFKCDFAAVSAPVKAEPESTRPPSPPGTTSLNEENTSDDEPSDGDTDEENDILLPIERVHSSKRKTHKKISSLDDEVDRGSNLLDTLTLSAPSSPVSTAAASPFIDGEEKFEALILTASSCDPPSSSSSSSSPSSYDATTTTCSRSQTHVEISAGGANATSITDENGSCASDGGCSSRGSSSGCCSSGSGSGKFGSSGSCRPSSSGGGNGSPNSRSNSGGSGIASGISSSSSSSSGGSSSGGGNCSLNNSGTGRGSSCTGSTGSCNSSSTNSASVAAGHSRSGGSQELKRAPPPPPSPSKDHSTTKHKLLKRNSAHTASPTSSSGNTNGNNCSSSSGSSTTNTTSSSSIGGSGTTHSHVLTPSGKIVSRIIPEPPKKEGAPVDPSATMMMPVVNPKIGLRTTKGRTAALNVSESSIFPSPMSPPGRPTTDGAIPSTQGADRVYFIGIIDMLVNYGIRKKGETMMKSLRGHKKSELSSVEPVTYADRIVKFLDASSE